MAMQNKLPDASLDEIFKIKSISSPNLGQSEELKKSLIFYTQKYLSTIAQIRRDPPCDRAREILCGNTVEIPASVSDKRVSPKLANF